MGTKLEVVCEQCGADGVADLGMQLAELNALDIKLSDPCPVCGGKVAPPEGGGKYAADVTGVLRRVGNYEGPPPPGQHN